MDPAAGGNRLRETRGHLGDVEGRQFFCSAMAENSLRTGGGLGERLQPAGVELQLAVRLQGFKLSAGLCGETVPVRLPKWAQMAEETVR